MVYQGAYYGNDEEDVSSCSEVIWSVSFEIFDDEFKQIIDFCANIRTVTGEASAANKNIWSLVMNDSSDDNSENDLLCYID